MNLNYLLNPDKFDRFGRRYPYKIELLDGFCFIGLYSGSISNADGTFEKVWFKIIDDIEVWKTNPDYIGGEMKYLSPDEVKSIVVYQ